MRDVQFSQKGVTVHSARFCTQEKGHAIQTSSIPVNSAILLTLVHPRHLPKKLVSLLPVYPSLKALKILISSVSITLSIAKILNIPRTSHLIKLHQRIAIRNFDD